MSAPKIHDGQLDMDESLVRRLLIDHFPHWADLSVTAVPTSGTENAIYRLGETMVIRLPYRPMRKDQIEKLAHWLPSLAPHLPLAIPEPLARGLPSKEFPAVWSIVRWLEGEEARLERIADPIEAATTLAALVRALMVIDATGVVDINRRASLLQRYASSQGESCKNCNSGGADRS